MGFAQSIARSASNVPPYRAPPLAAGGQLARRVDPPDLPEPKMFRAVLKWLGGLLLAAAVALSGAYYWLARDRAPTHPALVGAELAPMVPIRDLWADRHSEWGYRISPGESWISWRAVDFATPLIRVRRRDESPILGDPDHRGGEILVGRGRPAPAPAPVRGSALGALEGRRRESRRSLGGDHAARLSKLAHRLPLPRQRSTDLHHHPGPRRALRRPLLHRAGRPWKEARTAEPRPRD